MTALSISCKRPQMGQDAVPSYNTNLGHPIADNVKILSGSLVMQATAGADAGYCKPATAATGLIPLGVAEKDYDNTVVGHAAGAFLVTPRQGVFLFANSAAGDAITASHIGQPCYAVDDNTVAKTAGAGARSVAGIVIAVDSGTPGQSQPTGVWVWVSPFAPMLICPIAEWHKDAADGAANTATAEKPFGARINAYRNVSAIFLTPAAALTGHASDNAVITVRVRDGAGGAAATVAQLTTTASWTAFVPVSLGTITNGALSPGNVLTVEIAKGGSGVAVPASQLVVI